MGFFFSNKESRNILQDRVNKNVFKSIFRENQSTIISICISE